MSVNKVILLGYIGRQPELKYTSTSKPVLELSLATSEKFKDKESTEWHTVVFWNKQAEVLSKFMSKGSLLYVEGKNKTKSWEDKDGKKRYKTEVIGTNFDFVGPRTNSDKQDKPQQSFTDTDFKIDTTPSLTHDDIPF